LEGNHTKKLLKSPAFITILSVLIALSVLIGGKLLWSDKMKQAEDKDQNEQTTVMDWLIEESTQKETITISLFGDSVTYGMGASSPDKNWGNLLSNYLNNQQNISAVTIHNFGFSGYTTSRLIAENKINEVILSKPDIVIFEPTLINNFGSSISITQTEEEILSLIKEIEEQLPEALIIIQSTNPTHPNFSKNQNMAGNQYLDYVNSLKNFADTHQLNYVDIHAGMESLMVKNSKQLVDVMADELHPNDLGYQYWFETLKDSIKKTPLR
jgi:lysophospholipase L1-like esterase